MNELGELIKSKRLEKKHSLTRMAKLLGISSQRLGYYEKGRNKPKVDFFEKWEAVFKERLIVTNVTNNNNPLAKEGNNIDNATDPNYLIGIIKTQAETIHYLTTRGGGDALSKKASG